MTKFLSISTFRRRIAALLKIRKDVYTGVTDEICRAFKDASIEQIRQNRDMILLSNDVVVIKLRLPDKRQHLSRAEGYRLIYMVLKQMPIVVLLDIYPKRGPSQQLDVDDSEVTRLVQEFYDEFNAGTLVEHDINNNLKVSVQ